MKKSKRPSFLLAYKAEEALREAVAEAIAEHRGRIVGSAGDSVLAEFAGVGIGCCWGDLAIHPPSFCPQDRCSLIREDGLSTPRKAPYCRPALLST